jgi:hypothetical protein
MNDPRLPFDDALVEFRRFLVSQGWSSDLRWLTRSRLTGYRQSCWVYRPETLDAEVSSRAFYESTRRSSASLRLDGLAQLNGLSLVYVHNHGGDSRGLNFGVHTGDRSLSAVNSPLLWAWLRLMSAARGGSPFLRHTHMPVHEVPASAPPNGTG